MTTIGKGCKLLPKIQALLDQPCILETGLSALPSEKVHYPTPGGLIVRGKSVKKDEILNLHNLSEKEQWDWLTQNQVLQLVPVTFTGTHNYGLVFESLADCSYRLRTIAADSIKGKVAFLFWTHQIIPRGGLRKWIFRAKPINVIQAALLAILDSHIDADYLCRAFHVQNCHECKDVSCGDNPLHQPAQPHEP